MMSCDRCKGLKKLQNDLGKHLKSGEAGPCNGKMSGEAGPSYVFEERRG